MPKSDHSVDYEAMYHALRRKHRSLKRDTVEAEAAGARVRRRLVEAQADAKAYKQLWRVSLKEGAVKALDLDEWKALAKKGTKSASKQHGLLEAAREALEVAREALAKMERSQAPIDLT
jgi:hypothetical protein